MESIIEDTIRNFPSPVLTSMYERYLNGEKELCDELLAKSREHLMQVLRAPEPKPPSVTPSFRAPLRTHRSITVDTVTDILTARKKLDDRMDECIKASEVYRHELRKGCSEQDAYKIALEFYTALSKCPCTSVKAKCDFF